MGLFGMSKREKEVTAINGYVFETTKPREAILKSLDKILIPVAWKHIQGPGTINRINTVAQDDIQPIISIDITENPSGTRSIKMWLSSDCRFPDIYYDLMVKVHKTVEK